MPESGQIRINELARELEIKAKVLIEYLPDIGITEKKTHSSSLENEQADRVRKHFHDLAAAEAAAESEKQAKASAAKARPAARPAAPVPTTGAQAPASTAPVLAKPVVVPPAISGVKAPVRPGTVPLMGPRPAGAPVVAAPAAGHPPAVAPRTAPPSSGATTTIPAQRPGAPTSQRAPIVTRPAASGNPATTARPGSATGQGQRPSGGYSRPGAPPRPGGAPSGYRPAAGAQGAPRPGGTPMRPPQRPGGRPGQPMGRPASAAGQAPKAEPGKPLYVRKPPARAKPTIEKRFAEGERKLHPVRARAGALAGRGVGHAEPAAPPVVREPRPVTITEGITVRELAEKLDIRAKELLKNLLDRGVFASINQALDIQTATSLAEAFSGIVQVVSFEEQMAHEDVSKDDKSERLTPRAPVVTVMGHVDHGKTSLLDAIRSTDVAGGESGGITQHIGASDVHIDGKRIVFIDTPGHEAFTRMRARGAKVTDIVVLVVGADDGVMPQTLEAIDHARAAKVPIVVALNKIDKPDAQPERVKRQLADRSLLAEDWGGDVVMVPVSARAKTNLDLLLEMILLVADLQDLKANPNRPAMGSVLEAKLDRGRGPVATVLVANGTLRVGDYFICGAVFGRVRAMLNDRGEQVRKAEPSTPVEVLGLDSLPEAGDDFQVVTDTAKAKQIVGFRDQKLREQSLAKSSRLTLEQLHQQMQAGDVKELPLIIKTDVGGSAEVLSETLQKLSNDKIKVKVLRAAVGAINESDVLLASTSNAIVIGFNVRPERNAAALAEQEKVDIRLHTIIYNVTDEIKKAMSGLLAVTFKETTLGRAEVRDTFRV